MATAQIQIFRALSGHPSARLIFADGRRVHLHSAVSPECEAEYLEPSRIWGEAVAELLGRAAVRGALGGAAEAAAGTPRLLVTTYAGGAAQAERLRLFADHAAVRRVRGRVRVS